MSEPLVSVVTAFHNTAPYLAQCIESVLGQSYSRFEYILSDNCSTDGSAEIAESYVRRDARIRLIRQPRLLSQGEHYNNVLRQISSSSKYCKIVQADDWIFPRCLELMVQAFEQSESVGLVSSYYLKGNNLIGSGFPHGKTLLPGKEMAGLFLLHSVFVFGSESAVMYRSSLVRESESFFDASLLHADTEKCMQILQSWDFGFVPQVLSFLRTANVNESISAAVQNLQSGSLDWYIIAQRYATAFLEPDEAASVRRAARREYYSALAHAAIRFRGEAFWKYHQRGLQTIGESVNRPYLAWEILRALAWMAVNPGDTLARAFGAKKLET